MNTLTKTALASLLTLAWSAALPGLASGQDAPGLVRRPLSLEEAVEEALVGNPELSIAEARRDIAGGAGKEATAYLWPRLDAGAGYTHSVDPVFAFGTKLRQGTFTQEDLDLDALNNPDGIDDWSSFVSISWSLLDPTSWAGRASAKSQAEAAAWSAVRVREATVLMTRLHYYRALAASARLGSARSAVEAAEATLDLFSRRNERGLLTDADLLQAEAELAAAQAQQAEAERGKLDAQQDLGLHLGWSPDTLPVPTGGLPAPAAVRGREFDARERADVRARAAAVDAADAAKTQASLAYLPAVDLFGRFSTHAEDPFSIDGDNWTLGVALRWNLFSGFSRSASAEQVRLQRNIARTEYERTLRNAESELSRAERAVRSAERQIEAARAAEDAAERGRELMRRRFEEGLATAADLLQAEARATGMRERAINALATYHMAVAQLEFVRSQTESEDQR
ncbi:MAG: TolC family protein [Gemmatimonadota bacterium]|nr:MAG: TolC family protein [Gemmatimonadota bacterium]